MARRAALADLQPEASSNLALWLDRYASELDQEALRQHHRIALEQIKMPEGYPRAFEARMKALATLDGGFAGGVSRIYELTLQGRAVVGIGAASVRETSLSLLRPWGLPFIPGSALKGLASHVANEAGGVWARPSRPGEDAGAMHQRVFGDVKGAGAVTFHDAWCVPSPVTAVVADTMTVHHADYYGSGRPPADSDEPNPVSFLSALGKYRFALSGPPEAIDVTFELLKRGLVERGIGAKTAAGYGRSQVEQVRSEVARVLQAYDRPAAQPNTIAQLTTELLRYAGTATTRDEIAAAQAAAVRMIGKSPDLFRRWLADPTRTEAERIWFAVAAAPKPATPAPEQPRDPPTTEAEPTWTTGRAYARKDKKSRVEVCADGAAPINAGKLTGGRPSPELEQRLLDAQASPIEVEVILVGGKLRGIRERR